MAWESDLDGTWHLKWIIRTRLHFQYRRLQVSSFGHSKGELEILHTGGFIPPVFPEHFKSHTSKWQIYVTRIPSTSWLCWYSLRSKSPKYQLHYFKTVTYQTKIVSIRPRYKRLALLRCHVVIHYSIQQSRSVFITYCFKNNHHPTFC